MVEMVVWISMCGWMCVLVVQGGESREGWPGNRLAVWWTGQLQPVSVRSHCMLRLWLVACPASCVAMGMVQPAASLARLPRTRTQ
jgi:hypothetical protein